jgi:hypothetical protein
MTCVNVYKISYLIDCEFNTTTWTNLVACVVCNAEGYISKNSVFSVTGVR